MKKLPLLLSLLLAIAALSFFLYNSPQKETAATGTALIGGDFTLQDTEGRGVQDADFRGKLMLVYFGFTYCPDICPTGLQVISQAFERLGDKSLDVEALFITIDPARDTITQMKSYMQHFNPRIKGLTGTEAQVAKAAAAYRMYYNKAQQAGEGLEEENDYLMDHSAFIYLMDRQGKYLTHFAHNAPATEIADAILKNL